MEINTITAIGAAGTAIAAALPKEISIKMYDDLAHPSAKELGELGECKIVCVKGLYKSTSVLAY